MISFIIFFILKIAMAGEVCKFSGQLGPIDTKHADTVHIAQAAAVQAASKDIKSFCMWNRMGRTSLGLPNDMKEKYAEARNEGNDKEAVKIIKNDPTSRLKNHWHASLTGHPDLKNQTRNTPLANNEKSSLKIDEIASYAKTGKLRGRMPEEVFAAPKIRHKEDIPDVSGIKTTAACAYFVGLSSVPTCVRNIDRVLEYAAPMDYLGNSLAAAESFKKIMSDASYLPGLKVATVKLHDQLTSGKVTGDLFSDIQKSFLEAGDSVTTAEDKTWEVMATLAATGPNMAGRFIWQLNPDDGNFNPNITLLSAIAGMIPHLDTIAISSEKPRTYGLPPEMDFPCDSGKNYHFWMTAYLSRRLTKQGSSSEAAVGAAYIAQLGYQVKSETAGRSPKEQHLMQRFGNSEMGVQIDLNLAAAGATYGVGQRNKNVDITKNFQDSITSMGTSPSKNADDYSWVENGHTIWVDKFNPGAVLKRYQK